MTTYITGDFYDVQRFRDDPDDVRIEAWEQEEVGDVTGKTLLHLQCHFGLDTLSWARLGASHVMGVDFSEPAIAFANELAAETKPRRRARGSSSPTSTTSRGRSRGRRSTSSTPVEGRSVGFRISTRGRGRWPPS